MNPQTASLSTEERLADHDIRAAIERLFNVKKGVNARAIDVQCLAGIVELSGVTDNLLARERAAAIAKEVRGVRGVINQVNVRTPDVPDAELLRRVELALLQDPAVGDYRVRCTAHDGVLTVEGTLRTWTEKQLVLRVLNGVPGVRRIDCRLNIRGGEVVSTDEEITAFVREVLLWDIRVKSSLVDIRAVDGVVHLSGSVGTVAEREQVVTTAYVAGARHVDARDLFVVRGALDPALRHQKFAAKADEDIARAVRDTLYFDPRVRAFEPVVHVREGKVTLAGVVGNLRAREAAEKDAANVVGVWEVLNLLQVHTQPPVPDATIQEQVKATLQDDVYLTGHQFTVNVSHGKVQLHGVVASHFEQERALELAAGIHGVVEVQNRMQVLSYREEHFQPQPAPGTSGLAVPPLSAATADHLLEQRLRSHYYWSALLHDQDIDIEVLDGRVTLTGTVDSPLERKRAAEEALACGAQQVNNHLHLFAAG